MCQIKFEVSVDNVGKALTNEQKEYIRKHIQRLLSSNLITDDPNIHDVVKDEVIVNHKFC